MKVALFQQPEEVGLVVSAPPVGQVGDGVRLAEGLYGRQESAVVLRLVDAIFSRRNQQMNKISVWTS